MMTFRLRHLRCAAAALTIGTVFIAAPSAQAFTFENESAPNSGSASKFADPDGQVKNFGRNGLQFGDSESGVQVLIAPRPTSRFQDGGMSAPMFLGPHSFGAGNN